jgi:hypothetical protein
MYKARHSSREATSLSTFTILLWGALLMLVTSADVAAQARLIATDSVADLASDEVSKTLQISWKLEGDDSSLPPFLVQYSNDGGATWQVLAMNHRALSLEVSTENLPGGKSCLVRVLTTDPFTSSFSVSEPFRVITHAPFARISSPQAKQTFQTGEQILVRGFAYDVEDGSLNGKSMQWSIKGIGDIGVGTEALVSDLPPGRYSLILTAIDSEGQTSSTAEELVVVRGTKQKPAQ